MSDLIFHRERDRAGAVVLSIVGELDVAQVAEREHHVLDTPDRIGLRFVSFMDASAVGALERGLDGRSVPIVGSRAVGRVLDLCGLLGLWDVRPPDTDPHFDDAPCGVAVHDLSLRYRYINPVLADINGIARDAHLGRVSDQIFDPAHDPVTPILREVGRTGAERKVFIEGPRGPSGARPLWRPDPHPPHGASMKRLVTFMSLISIFAFVGAACGDTDDVTDAGSDAVDDVDDALPDDASDARDDFADVLRDVGAESAASAFEEIGVSSLTDSDEFTFLAPNDDAFRSMSADELADLLADGDRLTNVLRNHTLPEQLTAESLADRSEVTSELGTTLPVSVVDDTIMIGDATVVSAGVVDGDGAGIVHVVDAFLLPG